jgi:hypothetical protein
MGREVATRGTALCNALIDAALEERAEAKATATS